MPLLSLSLSFITGDAEPLRGSVERITQNTTDHNNKTATKELATLDLLGP